MNRLLTRLVYCLISIMISGAHAQGVRGDTVFLSSSIKNTKALYEQWIGGQSHLYNGVDTKKYSDDIDEFAFYLPDWEDGSVFYDNELYVNVPLMYDQIADKLIVSHFYSHAEIELISMNVDWFSLRNHKFVHLGNTALETGLEDGFYDLRYDGGIKLFVKRKKVIEEKIVMNKLESEVNTITRYFIFKDGHYYQVKKQSSVLTVLSDKKKALQAYAKQAHLDFKKSTEASIVQLVRYYDQADQ
jgi:hypothetical protein